MFKEHTYRNFDYSRFQVNKKYYILDCFARISSTKRKQILKIFLGKLLFFACKEKIKLVLELQNT